MKSYSLNKCRHILHAAYQWYKSKAGSLPPDTVTALKNRMLALETSINQGNAVEATANAQELEALNKKHFKKTLFEYTTEVFFAIFIALLLAVVVRQTWFELYEIPTGSMRPTFREQDHVSVSKTPFGINIPLTTGHFLFEPDLVQRTGIVTFTSEGINRLDEDTTFMWFIPYKKRLIKRMIGKPGDSLYFYGGKIYGVDKEGKPIEELISSPWMQNLEHIPFMRFSGEIVPITPTEVVFQQMNLPIGKLSVINSRDLLGEVYNGENWIKDDPVAQKTPHDTIKAYSDFFGMRNFAMARLLTKEELKAVDDTNLTDIPEGILYLELWHHPSLTYPKPYIMQSAHFPILLDPLKTIIPLQQHHLDALMDHMYTARLVFQNGIARRYSVDNSHFDGNSPRFSGVPDGTYEFYEGKLVRVGWGAITHAVDKANPLYSHEAKNVQKLFNLGIEMNNLYKPQGKHQVYHPSRYAYFRDGELYLLGAPILKKSDPILEEFNKEKNRKRKCLHEKNRISPLKIMNRP